MSALLRGCFAGCQCYRECVLLVVSISASVSLVFFVLASCLTEFQLFKRVCVAEFFPVFASFFLHVPNESVIVIASC